MNEMEYRMDFDTRRGYAYNKALEILDNDDDAFIEACNELDSWNGFMNDARCYSMGELDELLGETSPSKILSQVTQDFNINDDYFYFSIYGLESTDDVVEVYRNEHTNEEVLDALIDCYKVDIYDSELDRVVSILRNDDFGIDLDWEYDEDMDDDDAPEMTDDEFKSFVDG